MVSVSTDSLTSRILWAGMDGRRSDDPEVDAFGDSPSIGQVGKSHHSEYNPFRQDVVGSHSMQSAVQGGVQGGRSNKDQGMPLRRQTGT